MSKLRTLLEGELEKAEATLAARNLVDEIQDMLQNASKLQVEDLAALAETMRSNMSPEVAQAFQSSAQAALQTVVDCLTQAKTDLDNAVLTATGEAGAVSSPDMPTADSDDFGLDSEAPAVDDAAAGGESEPLGRAQRTESLMNKISALEQQLKEAKATRFKKSK